MITANDIFNLIIQYIHREILPNISISHGTAKSIWYLFFKVLDCAPVVMNSFWRFWANPSAG